MIDLIWPKDSMCNVITKLSNIMPDINVIKYLFGTHLFQQLKMAKGYVDV